MRLVLLTVLLAGSLQAAPRVEVTTTTKAALRGQPVVVSWQLRDAEGLKAVGRPTVAFDGATAFDLDSQYGPGTIKKVLIPERAGPLSIPAVVFALERTSDGAALSAQSEPLTIPVLESADSLLPAMNVRMQCSASRSEGKLIYTVELQALGDLRTALPRFRRTPPYELEVVPSEPRFLDDPIGGLRMVKTLTYSAKPPASEPWIIPRLELPFRNIESGMPDRTSCEGKVLMPTAKEMTPPPSAEKSKPGRARWAFPAILLASSIALFVMPRARAGARPEAAATSQVRPIHELRSRLTRMCWEAGYTAEKLESESSARGEIFRELKGVLTRSDRDAVDPEAQRLFDAFEAELRKTEP